MGPSQRTWAWNRFVDPEAFKSLLLPDKSFHISNWLLFVIDKIELISIFVSDKNSFLTALFLKLKYKLS